MLAQPARIMAALSAAIFSSGFISMVLHPGSVGARLATPRQGVNDVVDQRRVDQPRQGHAEHVRGHGDTDAGDPAYGFHPWFSSAGSAWAAARSAARASRRSTRARMTT